MGIVDLVVEIFRKNLGEDVVDLLRLYEQTYPPDWGLQLIEGSPSLMDFRIIGGDIAVHGFWYNANLDSIIALATQDLLLRLLINDTHSRFINNFGIGPIENIPRETMQAAIALACANSPYIAELRSVQIIDGDVDEIEIRIDAITPTGDSIGIGLPIGGEGT